MSMLTEDLTQTVVNKETYI